MCNRGGSRRKSERREEERGFGVVLLLDSLEGHWDLGDRRVLGISQVVGQSVREQRMKLMNLFFAMTVAMTITGTQRVLVENQ